MGGWQAVVVVVVGSFVGLPWFLFLLVMVVVLGVLLANRQGLFDR